MTVTLTLHRSPWRCDIYGGVTRVLADGVTLCLEGPFWRPVVRLELATVAVIALDEDGGAVE